MADVEDFIYQYEGELQALLLHLHEWLTMELGLRAKIRYRVPFYYGNSWICYLNPTKQNTIHFSLIRGNELSNSNGLLESKGRKQISSIELVNRQTIPHDALEEVMQEAILLDETVPYSLKRKSSSS